MSDIAKVVEKMIFAIQDDAFGAGLDECAALDPSTGHRRRAIVALVEAHEKAFGMDPDIDTALAALRAARTRVLALEKGSAE